MSHNTGARVRTPGSDASRSLSARVVSYGLSVASLLACVGSSTATEITVLISSESPPFRQAADGVLEEIGRLGMTTVTYELGGDLERGRKLAQRLRATDTDLVIGIGIKAARAAGLEVVDLPVVYTLVMSPQTAGLVALNISGVALDVPAEAQLSALRDLLPSTKRLGIVYDPAKSAQAVQEATRAAAQLDFAVVTYPIASQSELPPALRALLPAVDVLWLLPDTTVLGNEAPAFILQESFHHRRPVLAFSADLVKQGALLGFAVDYREAGRQAARLSHHLLTHQASTPIRQSPEHIRLALNMKTAHSLGVTIPPAFAARVEERY